MPNTSVSTKKKTNSSDVSQSTGTNNNNNNSASNSGASGAGSRARKRKRCETVKLSDSDLESEFEDCDLEDAKAIEKKLRKVAKVNSLSDEEMRMLLQKFVKNEHVLALVTLKAEDALAREKREADQHAILITDTPSVLKLTRAKARELNKTPGITLPSLAADTPQADIATLIKDDLHSDEEDEEYTFKEEDFISDDDPNTTISDLESNPCTPQTPLTQTDYEDSPVKLSADGCFKVPLDKRAETQEDLRIAARTRSKFCLQQTTIEDIQSEFVPPDLEQCDIQEVDTAATDEDWMQFLNDFSKPLNTSLVVDDDDPINDPEYVAAEKITVDAEELRDVNISKKELTELVAELFEGLINEGVSLESIELETPQKFVQHNLSVTVDSRLNTPNCSPGKQYNVNDKAVVSNVDRSSVMRQIDFSTTQMTTTQQACVSDATISSTNITQLEYSFQPHVMSTPAAVARTYEAQTLVPIAYATGSMAHSPCKTISIPDSALNVEPQLIAVPVPGQPNCYQLAKVLATGDALAQSITLQQSSEQQQPAAKGKAANANDTRYSVPYDNNFTWEYISIRKHVYSEYMEKFESLRHMRPSSKNTSAELPQAAVGFTQAQHDMLQQQLRIHVQFLMQNFVQTHSHPDLWKWSLKAKEMLLELQQRAETDASFNAWNLQGAVQLMAQWEQELAQDTPENKEFMDFIHREIELTNRNTRQIPRFPPRIMELMLNSNVFMYPQYLPRIPFTPKVNAFHVFSPAETQLIAMGLEKHMQRIRETGERISKKAMPLVVACERLSKDTVFGKSKRRIWDQIKALRKVKYYNPVKYFFEHNRAPPMEPQQLFTFEHNTVLPPKERFKELPLAWQEFVERQKNPTSGTQKVATASLTVSEQARNSYLGFVREAVGEDIQLPENFAAATQPDGSVTDLCTEEDTHATKRRKRQRKSSKKLQATSLVINVNYVFGATATPATTTSAAFQLTDHSSSTTQGLNTTQGTTVNTPQASFVDAPATPLATTPYIAYNYDCNTQTLQPLQPLATLEASCSTAGTQRKLTDFYELQECNQSSSWVDLVESAKSRQTKKSSKSRKFGKRLGSAFQCNVAQRDRAASLKHRRKLYLKRRCHALLTIYRQQLQTHEQRYQSAPLVQQYYKRFRALHLYSNLLRELKMFCRNAAALNAPGSGSPTAASGSLPQSPTSLGKRARAVLAQALDDETGTGARSKKANRQEENFRHMLLPDTADDANRKDAIYAFNFYEKVEEVLKSSKRPEDCKKFNHILKSFDPKRDKVADLYYKMEQLFLPAHPELAQVFLTFLLPSEAAEIGKFFEHFMITNMTTFISKLNVYFNKQPAQIRKIYNCLNELAEETHVTIVKIKTKILPLLKGNQFLIDWFMQQFPAEPPPERLLPAPEHVNLKEVQNNQSGEFMENVTDLLDSPTHAQEQQPSCQLRYINGRIFYGSKITLPAKLSFMAANNQQSVLDNADADNRPNGCIHGIREHGETRLVAAAAAAANDITVDCNSDDNDKSEEEDASKALVIDTTTGEEDSSSSIETCDDATLRAHAMRLNPSYYGNSCYASNTSTPNASNSYGNHHHNANVKKSSLNFNEEGKTSPRKHGGNLLPAATGLAALSSSVGGNTTCHSPGSTSATSAANAQLREKRKSPTKKIKSPVCAAASRPRSALQPMVVIHERNSAIACAKKLKSLIEEDSEADNKDNLNIVARTKDAIAAAAVELDTSQQPLLEAKLENCDDLEFLPENAEVSVTLSQSSFPAIKVDVDSNDEQSENSVIFVSASVPQPQHVDSDEDRKLDIVATLATAPETTAAEATNAAANEMTSSAANSTNYSTAWTRDEDKIILIEMKLGPRDRDDLFRRIGSKLPLRTFAEIAARHQFLMDFLSKLQGR